ncbi:Peptidase family M23 [Belliella buryatensis]|uniref:Peptidase family M23 n=1 Tax=Belliella buryatensis TaxID=1500549 RepID=A0A239C378_9BACT|nr:M23 family metallopeptidase [Belliella buryatensis]SNS14745.1 Peptidase family M23 [Belliella buryatensis]
MKLNKLFLLLFCLLSGSLFAQGYLFPVKPGQRNFLSGNFSEIRPNHFHSGIDIKIGGVDGEPILSIADGYVYRVKISSFGYGNVLYVKHPNGQSSVYAHLQKFSPKIMERMKQEMYAVQKNELEVYLDENTLSVKRGEVIGYGGNTGSSGGPHLHFEIRDSLDRAIEPLKFGFNKEVLDNTPPILYRIALRPMDFESRVNGKFERQEFTPILEGGRYVLPNEIKITGKVGLEVYAIDRQDGVSNIFGIPIYELLEEDKPIFRIDVDHIDFNKGRFFLTHTHQNRFVRLYPYPNNPMQLYEVDTVSKGLISAMDGQAKKLQVNMKDFFGNTRILTLNVVGEVKDNQYYTATSNNASTKITYQREVMVIDTKLSQVGSLAKVYAGERIMEIAPAYEENGRRIYLWNMDFAIPDSIDLCTELVNPEIISKIPFAEELIFTDGDVTLGFSDDTLLDDLFLRYKLQRRENDFSLSINPSGDYLQQNLDIKIHQAASKPDKSRLHVYAVAGNGRKNFVGGTWEGDDIQFKTRNFGTFVLDSDEIPPRILPIRVNASEIRFRISDEKSGIRDFEAFINGDWVMMRYEHKQAVIWSEKLDKQPFKGEVLLRVRDMAGNEATWTGIIQ